MNDRDRARELGQSLRAVLTETEGAARYEQYQRDVRRGTRLRSDGVRPLEFDENGFPIPQRNTGFLERVARLLSPS